MEILKMQQFSRNNEKICIIKSASVEGHLYEHIHDFFEIFYVIEGEGMHLLNGIPYPLKRGDLTFLSYNSKHNLSPLTSNFSWINCLFLSEVIDQSLINSQNAEDILRLSLFSHNFSFERISLADITLENAVAEFENIFTDMQNEYSAAKTGYQQILSHYLFILLFKIFRSIPNISKNEKTRITNNSIVDIVLKEIKENALDENTSLEDIAKKAYISPKYFSKLFKQETGQTLMNFIHKIKINRACELLETTNMNISEIINQVGYKDSKFFYKLFLRHTGLTPGDYKSNFKSK